MTPHSSRQILVVDDDPQVRSALVRTLKADGYQPTAADGAEVAIGLMSTRSFDAILSDHMMPDMSGLELLKLVRSRWPDTMRIMLTGHAETQMAIDAINHGEIFRFLTKPFEPTELLVMLHVAFEQLDVERENRNLLALVRHQQRVIERLKQRFPGLIESIDGRSNQSPAPELTVVD